MSAVKPATTAHPLATLELTLRQMINEYKALLAALDAHEKALRKCAIDGIEKATREQDFARQKIAATESRRRVIIHQLARQHRTIQPPTLVKLSEIYPERKLQLIALRAELADVSLKIQRKSSLVARIAQSVLGHVNATLRLVATAAAGPSSYTRRGDAPLPNMRMGVLNAVA
jgi:hypothetical protein